MAEQIKVQKCICGALWGLDLRQPHTVRCYLCGAADILVIPEGDYRWSVQHGVNPEHRSPTYEGGALGQGVCDWIDEVHARA